jgi:hypothetical protein
MKEMKNGEGLESFPFDTMEKKLWRYVFLAPFFLVVGLYANTCFYFSNKKKKNWKFRSWLFNSRAKEIRDIQDNGGNATALHILYLLKVRPLKSFIDRIWTSIPIIQGVQNRAVLVRQVISEVIRWQFDRYGKELRIVELAAGLAEPLLWGLKDLEKEGVIPARVLLTDISRNSLKQAQEISTYLEVKAEILTERLNLTKFDEVKELLEKEQPNVVEMIGFIDYLDDDNVVELFKIIKAALPDNSSFIVGNVLPTWERYFIESSYGWPPMHYRSSEELHQLMCRGMFSDIDVTEEPAGRFCIGVAKV